MHEHHSNIERGTQSKGWSSCRARTRQQSLLFGVFPPCMVSIPAPLCWRRSEPAHRAAGPTAVHGLCLYVKNFPRQWEPKALRNPEPDALWGQQVPSLAWAVWTGSLSRSSSSVFHWVPPTPLTLGWQSSAFLPQTQWKVNWMFYALTLSKKWKERRFQPYFNNKCINFYLLTDTCTNFLKCSLWFFFDLSGFVGLMMRAYFKCKEISSLFLNSTITDSVMSPSWKRAGTDF